MLAHVFVGDCWRRVLWQGEPGTPCRNCALQKVSLGQGPGRATHECKAKIMLVAHGKAIAADNADESLCRRATWGAGETVAVI